MKKCLVVDTWVLARSSDVGCQESKKATKVLQSILEKCPPLFVDKTAAGSRILKEYRTHAKGYAGQWYRAVSNRNGKIRKVEIKKRVLPHGTVKDRFDVKFPAVCLNSSARIIISEDYHLAKACGKLKKWGILVLTLDEALIELETMK